MANPYAFKGRYRSLIVLLKDAIERTQSANTRRPDLLILPAGDIANSATTLLTQCNTLLTKTKI